MLHDLPFHIRIVPNVSSAPRDQHATQGLAPIPRSGVRATVDGSKRVS